MTEARLAGLHLGRDLCHGPYPGRDLCLGPPGLDLPEALEVLLDRPLVWWSSHRSEAAATTRT